MSYRLPIYKIVADTLSTTWIRKEEYLRAISAPTLVLVIIWALWSTFPKQIGIYGGSIGLLVYGLGFSLFAVTCHRLILVRGEDRYIAINVRFSIRELKFLGWLASVYAIVTILEAIPSTIVMNMSDSINPEEERFYWTMLLLSIPALYVLGRVSLVFPATAIDRKVSLKWSWIRTKNNGWRMFVVVGLFPWLLSVLIWLMWREDATTLEKVILTLASYLGFATEVFALSHTYKEFENHYELRGLST